MVHRLLVSEDELSGLLIENLGFMPQVLCEVLSSCITLAEH